VIGGAIGRSRAAGKKGNPLGVEFFLALFMLTNIRNFAVALDSALPADSASPRNPRPRVRGKTQST
jgi:hypothetical protein